MQRNRYPTNVSSKVGLGACSSNLSGVEKSGFGTSYGFQAQKVPEKELSRYL